MADGRAGYGVAGISVFIRDGVKIELDWPDLRMEKLRVGVM